MQILYAQPFTLFEEAYSLASPASSVFLAEASTEMLQEQVQETGRQFGRSNTREMG